MANLTHLYGFHQHTDPKLLVLCPPLSQKKIMKQTSSRTFLTDTMDDGMQKNPHDVFTPALR